MFGCGTPKFPDYKYVVFYLDYPRFGSKILTWYSKAFAEADEAVNFAADRAKSRIYGLNPEFDYHVEYTLKVKE